METTTSQFGKVDDHITRSSVAGEQQLEKLTPSFDLWIDILRVAGYCANLSSTLATTAAMYGVCLALLVL